jgi:hypothetical protein
MFGVRQGNFFFSGAKSVAVKRLAVIFATRLGSFRVFVLQEQGSWTLRVDLAITSETSVSFFMSGFFVMCRQTWVFLTSL